MSEHPSDNTNSTQPTESNNLDQQIASKQARLAEQNRLLTSARLRFHVSSSDGKLYDFEESQRRQELYTRIIRQPHHKHIDSGPLPGSSGAIVDLILDSADDSRLKFVFYQPPESQDEDEEPQLAYSDILTGSDHAYLPPDADSNLLKSIRMPTEAAPYESLQQLISGISQLILRCVAVSQTDARLLAHFVLSTWLIDRLPVAPYLALVGPPQSGKTTLLRVLHLLCRRSLFASDASSVTLLHVCHQLHPTLLIDETSSIDDPVAMRRLLRVGNTPGSLVLRHKQSWNVFGAKVVCWRELPDDAALNSRCIILPMHGVNDPALRLPDDPEIITAAAALQSQLLYYRLANYNAVTTPALTEQVKSLPPRKRELYLALAAPCSTDEPSRNFLLDYFRDNNLPSDDFPSAAEQAVLVALFHMAHMPEHRSQPLTKEIAARANRYLHDEREHLQLQIRRVGAILTGCGYARRRRTKKGWVLELQADQLRRLHGIAKSYGIDYMRDEMPGFTACRFCPDVPPTDPPTAVGILIG